MWSSSILWAIFGKEKSPETFCFKTFSVVEATGLEPTTFWSLRHNRKFFIYFPDISKPFVSATDAFLYSCSHCFHVVQIRKWSKVWSNAVFCGDHTLIFSKRYTHVRVYSFGSNKSIVAVYEFQLITICKQLVAPRYFQLSTN